MLRVLTFCLILLVGSHAQTSSACEGPTEITDKVLRIAVMESQLIILGRVEYVLSYRQDARIPADDPRWSDAIIDVRKILKHSGRDTPLITVGKKKWVIVRFAGADQGLGAAFRKFSPGDQGIWLLKTLRKGPEGQATYIAVHGSEQYESNFKKRIQRLAKHVK